MTINGRGQGKIWLKDHRNVRGIKAISVSIKFLSCLLKIIEWEILSAKCRTISLLSNIEWQTYIILTISTYLYTSWHLKSRPQNYCNFPCNSCSTDPISSLQGISNTLLSSDRCIFLVSNFDDSLIFNKSDAYLSICQSLRGRSRGGSPGCSPGTLDILGTLLVWYLHSLFYLIAIESNF